MKHTIDTHFYPGWTRKSFSFTIDDGVLEMDKKFMDILAPAGIRGTFNLCSDRLKEMTAEEYREFYRGHEIANHCKYHPYAFADGVEYRISDQQFDPEKADKDMLYCTDIPGLYRIHMPKGWRYVADTEGYISFIDAGHRGLEAVFGEGSVNSFVWPFTRQINREVERHLAGMSYYGVRTTGQLKPEELYRLPRDPMQWIYTAAHENLLERAAVYEALEDDGELKFFSFGVHSIDYERNNKWDDLRTFARTYGYRPADYYYAPVGEIIAYAKAVEQIIVSDNCIKNPTKLDLYIRIDGENRILKADSQLSLAD